MIEICNYTKKWKSDFKILKTEIWPAISSPTNSIEHVGSTSIEGLCAKPVIDIDIIFQERKNLQSIIDGLARLGYRHLGDLGIENRDAFKKDDPKIKHNLYACLDGCASLQNHLILRDHLRANVADRKQYGELKKKLANMHPNDIDAYIEGKTEFILNILGQYDLNDKKLQAIKIANKKPS